MYVCLLSLILCAPHALGGMHRHACTAASVLSQDVGPIPSLHPLSSQIVFTTLLPVQACPVFVSFDFVTLGLEREVIYSPLVNHIISGEKYYLHALLKERGPRSC